MVLLRRVIGDTLRAQRLSQHRTLREVSTEAKVSLGYLSEVERGQKEASSELLSSICEALGVRLSAVLRDVSDNLAVSESPVGVLEKVGAGDGVHMDVGEFSTADFDASEFEHAEFRAEEFDTSGFDAAEFDIDRGLAEELDRVPEAHARRHAVAAA